LKSKELLIAESVDGVELGGTRSRIEAGSETDKDAKMSAVKTSTRERREFDGLRFWRAR